MDVNELPSDGETKSLVALANRLYEAEENVLRLEAELKRAKAKRDGIATVDIPDMLDELEIKEITTKTCKIVLKDHLSVTPLKKNRPRVFKVLREQEAGHLIKNTVSVRFNPGEDKKASTFAVNLLKKGLQVTQESKVEPPTLKKHVKGRLEEGLAVDEDLFGVRQWREAKFEDGAPKPPVFEGE